MGTNEKRDSDLVDGVVPTAVFLESHQQRVSLLQNRFRVDDRILL